MAQLEVELGEDESEPCVERLFAGGYRWLLSIDGTPIYIVSPVGPQRGAILQVLARAQLELDARLEAGEGLGHVCVAGYLTDAHEPLTTGEWLPVLELCEPHAVRAWTLSGLVDDNIARLSLPSGARRRRVGAALHELLEHGCTRLRNPGQCARDRALNLALSEPRCLAEGLAEAAAHQLELDEMCLSPAGAAAGVAAWELLLIFYDPKQEGARWASRFALDIEREAFLPTRHFGQLLHEHEQPAY